MIWVIWLSLWWAKEQARPIWLKNFRIDQSLSNRIKSDGRFEFKSNLEALQVPKVDVRDCIEVRCVLQAEGETEVLVAGDPELRHMAMCDKQGGMRYHPNAIEILVRLRF